MDGSVSLTSLVIGLALILLVLVILLLQEVAAARRQFDEQVRQRRQEQRRQRARQGTPLHGHRRARSGACNGRTEPDN